MDIGIIVFAYNRSWHLNKVLEGLRKNTEVTKLYIFQDGLKHKEHQIEWERTHQVIKDIDWCEVLYYQSSYNKGLAASIVDGINEVFEENDAVVVLEDDCVPTANFISFMRQCFEKYEDDKRIYSVSGYSWPIELPKDEYDIYGCGRNSSWGWGTWKDRWEQYSIDPIILKRLKKDKDKSKCLATWRNDCEQTLLNNISGMNDSWAIYWGLNIMAQNGICINPYESLIQNIGTDGSGVHCGVTDRFSVKVSDGFKSKFLLPDKLDILHTTETAFANLYGSYTATNLNDKSKENVIVYGIGNFYFQHEKEINDVYNIEAFIDRKRNDWYSGKKLIKLNEVQQYDYSKIIIMVQDIQECINIAKELIDKGIDSRHIILGHSLYGEYSKLIDKINVLSDGRLILAFGDISIQLTSKTEFNNVCEVFIEQIYNYFLNNEKQDIIFDVGMNIADATLYFINQNKVEKVYGYEPFEATFSIAEENLKDYLNTGKVNIFQYGISSKNETRMIGFNKDMSCGQSTLEGIREKNYQNYLDWGLVKPSNEQMEQIDVRKASEVFEPIISGYPDHNIILKMGCEGEEYGILEELLQSGTLDKFCFIMLEWHYNGKDIILNYLRQADFSWWCNDKSRDRGLIYAYK